METFNTRWMIRGLATLLFLVFGICEADMEKDRTAAETPRHNLVQYHNIDIPTLQVADALNRLAEQTGALFMFPYDIAESRTASAVKGEHTVIEALGLLLQGSGLASSLSEKGVIQIYLVDSAITYQTESSQMTQSKKGLLAALVSIFSVSSGQSLIAQEAGQNLSMVEEVLVTASRREESLQNVGAAITSVNPDTFTAAGLTRLEDIIDYTPGVNFTSNGGSGFGNVTMRGATQESSSPVVGIYIDDVPFTTGSPFSFGSSVLFDGVLGDIERIEIVKGPQGTLYGANSMGGVIRYVTKDPALEEMRGSLSADLSHTTEGDLNQRYQGSISVPLVKDTLGFSFSGVVVDEPGFVDRVDSPLTTAKDDIGETETEGYQASLLWKINDAADLKVTTMHYETDLGSVPNIDLNFPDGSPLYGDYLTDDPALPQTLEYDNYAVTLNVDFGWANFTSVTAHVEYVNDVFQDATPDLGGLVDLFTGSVPGTNSVPVPLKATSEKLVQEFRLTSPASEQLEWILGAFYTDEDTTNDQSAIAQPTGFNLFDVAFPSVYEELALFGNLTWYVTPEFDLTFGARYSDNSLTLDARFAGLLATGDPNGEVLFGEKIDDTVGTYLFGARWRPSEQLSLYVRAASGYRPASVNLPIFDPFTGENLVEPLVDADELWSYEVGAKGGSADGSLSYDMALWYIQWDEFQASVVINGIGTGGNAQASVEASGFEGSFTWRPTDPVSVQMAVSYTDSGLDADDPSLSAEKGERSRLLPDWTASMRVAYQFQLAGFDGQVGGGLRHVGGFNTAYRSGVIGSGGIINTPVDAYTLLDFDASLSTDRYNIGLYATNLTDEYDFSDLTARDSFGAIPFTGLLVKPRTVGVRVGLTF